MKNISKQLLIGAFTIITVGISGVVYSMASSVPVNNTNIKENQSFLLVSSEIIKNKNQKSLNNAVSVISECSSSITIRSKDNTINKSVSSAVPSKGQVKKTNNIQDNSKNTVSQQLSSSNTLTVTIKHLGYAVINPDTGAYVPYGSSDYEKIKAELGGDAGTVNPDKSTACQKAAEEARQKYYEKQKAENEGKPTSSQDLTNK